MEFTTITNERLGETVLYAKHPTGLDIFIAPKKGYASQYAIFGTRYGSIDNHFHVGDKDVTVPEGIAHFLEHKLFESEDGDAFSRYARTGASANAYTSFDRTCYLFSSTERFRESLEILLDFVQSPYFTEQTVQKEQGIIGQEIKMYEDDPAWRVMFNLLGAIYHKHPVKIDIAGTTESISHITADLLYECYHAFYNLHNMALCVAGDVDPQVVAELADKLLKDAPPSGVESQFDEEPAGVVQPRVEQRLSVSVPLFNLGFKDLPASGKDAADKEAVTSILLEILCGTASPFYRKLYDAGLINSSFGTESFTGRSFSTVLLGGESRDPDAVAEAVYAEIDRLKRDGIDKEAFVRAKKYTYGRLVSHYDHVDGVANAMAGLRFLGMGPFDMVEAVAQVTEEDVKNRLETVLRQENAALSVILPVESAQVS
ncbi:EF-P 5-aminopentanol modification-associated protein YfmH [Ethanoligenens sp.]|uniref:EF-P 5-aminopentanol modification-associated protein YfmH n=1 Tax=Ethanoligenens sp. TaxID=2099655 RepID=UPI0039E963A8